MQLVWEYRNEHKFDAVSNLTSIAPFLNANFAATSLPFFARVEPMAWKMVSSKYNYSYDKQKQLLPKTKLKV